MQRLQIERERERGERGGVGREGGGNLLRSSTNVTVGRIGNHAPVRSHIVYSRRIAIGEIYPTPTDPKWITIDKTQPLPKLASAGKDGTPVRCIERKSRNSAKLAKDSLWS